MQVSTYRVPVTVSLRIRVTNAPIVLKRTEPGVLEVLNGAEPALVYTELAQNLIVQALGNNNPLTQGLLAATDYEPIRATEIDLVAQRIARDYVRKVCEPETYLNPTLTIQVLAFNVIQDPR